MRPSPSASRSGLIPLPDVKVSERERLWLRLRHTKGMNRPKLARLITRFGGPEAVLGATAAQLIETQGITSDLARAILDGALSVDLDKEAELIEKYRVRIITALDDEYPANLRTMPDAPAMLYCMGALAEGDRFAVTVVGTRNTTGYGAAACEEVVGALSDAGLTIVSGLAVGVDAAAHQTALRHGGRTLAVMGNGLARVYPEENESLAWKICHEGALLSEYAMTMPPDRYNFPERNEILAGLSLAAIVIEAPDKSGALLTARAALNMGRAVFAVPGDVTRANSRGCNQLIREGATLIREGRDVIEDLYAQLKELLESRKKEQEGPEAKGLEAGERGERQGAPTGAKGKAKKRGKKKDLNLEEAQIVDLVRQDARHFDALYETARSRGVQIDAGGLSAILLQLELKGFIRQAPGKMFVAEEVDKEEDGEEM